MKVIGAVALLLALVSCHGKDVILGAPDPPSYVEEPAACRREVLSLASIPGIDPRFLLRDAADLYAVSSGAGGTSIWKVPKVDPPVELASGMGPISGIALSMADEYANRLLFTSDGALMSIQTSGGDIAILASGREDLGAVVAALDKVYWAETQRAPDGSKRGAVAGMVLPYGSPQTFAQTPDATPPRRFTTWNGGLVWTTSTGDVVTSSLRFATGPSALFHGASGVLGTYDALFLSTGVSLVALHSDGTRMELPVSYPIDDIAAYDTRLYFFDGARFTTTSVDFSQKTSIAVTAKGGALAVDSRCVYFVDADAGAVEMIQK